MNRRQFLKSTGAGAVGMIAARKVFAAPATSPIGDPAGANSDIRVAVVGVRNHGRSHIKAYQSMPGVRLVALCDVDEQVLGTQVAELEKANIRVKTYRDIRKLLESKGIDAISCALPNRWHSLAAVWGCQAGKDVCIEKPISHCIWEGRKAVEAARKYGRMVQADLDSRSRPALDEAFAFVRSGQIGKIVYARAWDYKRRETMGKVTGPQKIPPGVDYDLWTGPGPMHPLLRQKLHYDWHWQWHTGSGEIANNGSHQLDQIRWALGKDLPKAVISFGGRFGYADDGQTPNTHVAIYDFDTIPVIYEARGLPQKTGASDMPDMEAQTSDGRPIRISNPGVANQGILIVCEGGYYARGSVYDHDGKEISKFKSEEFGKRPQENFINAVRSRKIADLKTDILQGHLTAITCHMGNVPIQTGEPVTLDRARTTLAGNAHAADALNRMFGHLTANDVDPSQTQVIVGPTLKLDPTTERFTGNGSEQANLFIKDSYRSPFVIPDVA